MSKAEYKNPRIFIDKRGNWYQDGIKITHIWTYLANNKNLDIDEQGRFFVDEGTGRMFVEVEDTPFVVKMVHKVNGSFYIRLNDQSDEKLDFNTLDIGNENVLYTEVKNGKFNARFTRPAYYELMKYVELENQNYYIESDGEKHKISKELAEST